MTINSSNESWSVSGSGQSLSLNGGGGISLSSGSGSINVSAISGVNLSSYSGTVTLHAGGSKKIIMVGDANTSYIDKNLSDYPINWSAIKNVSINWDKVNKKKALQVFGYVLGSPDSEDQQEVRPAVAVGYTDLGDMDTYQISSIFYMSNSGTWTRYTGTSASFISLY